MNYKLKEGNSVRDRVSGISLKGSSSSGGASKNTAIRHEEYCNKTLTKSKCCRKDKGYIRSRPEIAQDMAVNQPKPLGRGVRDEGFTV